MDNPKKMLLAALALTLVNLGSMAFASKPDNSEVNQRDQQAGAVTAEQQSSNPKDVEISRDIRRKIVTDKDLSLYAQNIKIITVNGEVTLKGPVRTEYDVKALLKTARATDGVSKVVSQLEIAHE